MLRHLGSFLAAFIQTLQKRWARGPARASWPFGFELIVRYLRRDWDETKEWPIARLRADMDARPYPQAMAKKLKLRDVELGGVPARWFVPAGVDEARVVLYLHGGSFLYGSARTSHADLVARLALAAGVAVVALEYRLAPEAPFPAQLDDALAAFDALVASGKEVVVAGDSAGGNLALVLQLALRDRGEAQAKAALLVSPWADLEMPGASFTENDAFDYGDRDGLVTHARLYAGGTSLRDPRVSPIHARLEGLAPVLVTVGTAEILRDDILLLGERLRAAGVEARVHEATDMPHNAPVFAAYHPSAQATLDACASFLGKHLVG